MSQKVSLVKFIVLAVIFQVCMGVLYGLMVRYAPSADSAHTENRMPNGNPEVKEILSQYPMIIDIHVMLLAGFGFLMTFLKHYNYSALGFTIIITCLVTEFAILCFGFSRISSTEYTINITMIEVLEGGLAAATVLVSFGVLIGKLNPLQLFFMGLVETVLFVVNCHIGYVILGVIDGGGSIFIHAFGAYFGIAVSLAMRWRNYTIAINKTNTRPTTDVFSLLGAILLWLYWPSFNALLASEDARHRAYINTYISLVASTVCTFIASSLLGDDRKFNAVDIQNATLSGGVIVGATADMMLQPYGAFTAGCVAGIVSTVGYQIIQPWLEDFINLHDSCGVNNLHGMPGILAGLFSAVMCAIAEEGVYGPALYLVFPSMAPQEGTIALANLTAKLPAIEPGLGRTAHTQALMQLASLGITLVIAIVMGLATGFILNSRFLCSGLDDKELFDDIYFWNMPETSPMDVDSLKALDSPTAYRAAKESMDGNVSALTQMTLGEDKLPKFGATPGLHNGVPQIGVNVNAATYQNEAYNNTGAEPNITAYEAYDNIQARNIAAYNNEAYDNTEQSYMPGVIPEVAYYSGESPYIPAQAALDELNRFQGQPISS